MKVSIIKDFQKQVDIGECGGALDMESEGKSIRLETLESIHETKTGALLNFSVMAAVDIAQVEQNI